MQIRTGFGRGPLPALLLAGMLLVGAGAWLLASAPDALARSQQQLARKRVQRDLLDLAERTAERHADLLQTALERDQRRHQDEIKSLLPLILTDEDARREWLVARQRAAAEGRDSRARAVRDAFLARLVQDLTTQAESEASLAGDAVGTAARKLVAQALLLAGLLVAALASLAGWLHQRRVRRPLAQLTAIMTANAAGDDARMAPQGAAELQAASAAFNAMVDALSAARRKLRGEVDRQTAALAEGLEEHQTLNRRLTEVLDELRATQARLLRQEKMAALGTLAGGVAHEFNNLLGGIRGCVDDALEDIQDTQLEESLAVIRRAAERGSKIVEGLLRFSQAAVRDPQILDLSAVVRETAALLKREADDRKVTLDLDLPGDLTVRADAVEIHQVVHNLLLNAIQLSPEQGCVEVSGRLLQGRCRLCVLDRGPGIAPGDRAHIFEPFFTTREREGGCGLGLAMCQGIVQALGGELHFEDRPAGGTIFVLELPGESSP